MPLMHLELFVCGLKLCYAFVLIMLEYQLGNSVTPCFMIIMVILHTLLFVTSTNLRKDPPGTRLHVVLEVLSFGS